MAVTTITKIASFLVLLLSEGHLGARHEALPDALPDAGPLAPVELPGRVVCEPPGVLLQLRLLSLEPLELPPVAHVHHDAVAQEADQEQEDSCKMKYQ